ncbi:MAG: alanine racemase, partial [Patescibacteria group bacterium]|nr:alanine racemase [Patescibacteria group bacterium]
MKQNGALKQDTSILQRVKKILSEKQSKKQENLIPLVKKFINRKEEFLQVAQTFQTPCYILDAKELQQSIRSFDKAFRKEIPGILVYYAMKTNDNPYLLKTISKHGWGLDVSSVREFDLAQKSGCKDLIYTGPAKTKKDLEYVLKKDPNIIIQIDSFGELERLGEVTKKLNKPVKAGVRISTASHKKWSKFGIPIKDLKTFWNYAEKFSFINLQGIQFHLSWNEDVKPYQKAIKELSIYLTKNFTKTQLDAIRFIDFGGGFRPYQSEGTFPWLLPQGSIIKTANDYFNQPTDFAQKYIITPAVSIEEYAKGIGKAISQYLKPLVSCVYFTE